MRKRTRFVPRAVDVLEERQLLTSASAFLPTSMWQNVASAFGIDTAKTKPVEPVGTLGDSSTAVYKLGDSDQVHARNWVEILGSTRRAYLSFGRFSTHVRGTQQNQGYNFDWAQPGATTSDVVQEQLPGLVSQIEAGKVKYSTVFMGSDDFLGFLLQVKNGTIPLAQAPAALAQVEQRAAANFQTVLQALLAANSHERIVAFTIPAVSILPAVQAEVQANPQYQSIVAATDQAIQAYNASIKNEVAGNLRIALVDLAAQAAQITSSTTGTMTYGGVTVNLTTPGDSFKDLFLADGVHLGTIGQGMIAADFISALDTSFSAGITALAPSQIVRFAENVQKQTQRGSGGPP